MLRDAGLVLVAVCFLIALQPEDLQAGLFEYGAIKNATAKGFNLLNFLFGGPRTCNCQCGRTNRLQNRLQGGQTTEPNEYPWLAAVTVNANNASRVYSGALVNDRYVITAASNLNRTNPLSVRVTLGASNRCLGDLTSVNLSVASITPLPNFDPTTGNHDIALLQLSNPITFNTFISPICMPQANSRYEGLVATITSWGGNTTNATRTRRRRSSDIDDDIYDWTEYDDDDDEPTYNWHVPTSRQKRQAPGATVCLPKSLGLPVLGEGQCPSPGLAPQIIQPDTGCAGVIGTINPVCASDAGAPVEYRDSRGIYQLIGIISQNNSCNVTAPTLYTIVNPYVNWIYQNTPNACYCS